MNNFRYCEEKFENVEACFAAECIGDYNCKCIGYVQAIDSKKINRVCDSCDVCASGSALFESECSNLGLGTSTCGGDANPTTNDTSSKDRYLK